MVYLRRIFSNVTELLRWLFISSCVGLLAGGAIAFFAISLNWVTHTRETHMWLVYLLPVAGLLMGWLYTGIGKSVAEGNDLIIDEIHDSKKAVPLRMAPLILFATLVSHLFGGSVGREGTAVQMGGGLADMLTRPFKLNPEERKILLISGLAAGFAAIFGTPLAGAVFGMEVLTTGRIRSDAVFPALLASIIAFHVTQFFGVHELRPVIGVIPLFDTKVLMSVIFAGACFGLIAWFFATAIHAVQDVFKRSISASPLRPFVGGLIIAGLFFIFPAISKFLGLGTETIDAAFKQELSPWDFAGKLGFTALTLGSGFKGGEVTPMFFIGATLGNALSRILPLSLPLLAGLGFVAVFAGASNTPIASTLLAMEYFGADIGVLAGIACVVSCLFAGYTGIYHSQRVEKQGWRRSP